MTAPLVVASMIVKNEAGNLPGVFAAARGLVDAWVIVDTGSDDDTRAVARALGEQHGVAVVVHTDPWDDDFARSRNVCLDLIDALCGDATGDGPTAFAIHDFFGAWVEQADDGDPIDPNPWILILDGDDRTRDVAPLREALEDPDPEIDVVGMHVESATPGGTETVMQPRVWRRLARVRYQYPCHLEPILDGLAATVLPKEGGWIEHLGYADAEHLRGNAERTLRILRAKMDSDHPHRIYCEARALTILGKHRDASRVAARGVRLFQEHGPESGVWQSRLWQIAAQRTAHEGNLSRAVRILAGGTQVRPDHAHVDLWLSLLQTAALGLMQQAMLHKAGAPGIVNNMAAATGVLEALEDAGVIRIPDDAAAMLFDRQPRTVETGPALEEWLEDYPEGLVVGDTDRSFPGWGRCSWDALDGVKDAPAVALGAGFTEDTRDRLIALVPTETPILVTGVNTDDAGELAGFLAGRLDRTASLLSLEGGDPVALLGELQRRDAPRKAKPKRSGPLRVLVVAPNEIAGQAGLITRALNEHTPHSARFVQYARDYIGAPDRDLVVEDGEAAVREALKLADDADLLHFIRHPVLDDVFAWGKRMTPTNCLVQYYGSQLRDNGEALAAWHQRTGVLGVSAWDWTMLERSPMPYHLPMLCDVEAMGRCKPWHGHGPLRICHPTTNRAFKKTGLFLSAVAEANQRLLEGNASLIEPVIIEGVSNAECLAIKRSCHATFDQLSTGIYGVSAVESMAMGHVVIGGISPWARSVEPDLPIMFATPDTLATVFVDLALDWGATNAQGSRCWAYVRRKHDPAKIIQRVVDLYTHVLDGNRLLRPDEA